MLVGVPKEIKDSEYRVGLVPSTVRELTRNGHHVLVEKSAGLGAGIADAHYLSVGAEIVPDADSHYSGMTPAAFGRLRSVVFRRPPQSSLSRS